MKHIFPSLRLFLSFITLAILSWILIHLLSLFGFFLAFAFPLWWLISPNSVPCFGCRITPLGGTCPFCKIVVADPVLKNPHSLKSTLLNCFVISFFTLLSMGLVFLESRALNALGFPPSPKTVSFIAPDKAEKRLGEIFPLEIEISGIKEPINTVRADIAFDPVYIRAVRISTDNSFAKVFVTEEIDNEKGYVRVAGGLPNPGYEGSSGGFATIFFEAISPGIAEIRYLPSSLVLANDGKGTNVLKDLSSTSYLIIPEKFPEDLRSEQVDLIIQADTANVLGEKVEDTQIKLTEEGSVLGSEQDINFNKELPSEPKSSIGEKLANLISVLDRFIVDLWQKVIAFFGSLFKR